MLPSKLYHPETGISNADYEDVRRYFNWRDAREQEAIDAAKKGR